MRRVRTTGSINPLINRARNTRRRVEGRENPEELKKLIQLQNEAFEESMQNATDSVLSKAKHGLAGLQKAYKLQEEYKEAKTGVKSRYGNIAKAFGITDAKGAAMIDKIFGSKVGNEQLAQMREKFGITDRNRQQQNRQTATRTQRTEESAERSRRRDEQLTKIEDLTNQIFNMMNGIKDSVDGIANRLRASAARDMPSTSRGRRNLERQAGLKYSREANRYKDVRTGKFVSETAARQRMNLRPGSATRVISAATRAPAAAAVAAAAGTASRVMRDDTPMPQRDPNAQRLNDIDQRTQTIENDVKDILNIFSMKKFYALIGGAIGFALPLLKKTVEWLWDIGKKGANWIKDVTSSLWDSFKKYLSDVKLTIPKFGVFGPYEWEPFNFLKPVPEVGKAQQTPAPAGSGGGGGSTRGGARGGSSSAAVSGGGGSVSGSAVSGGGSSGGGGSSVPTGLVSEGGAPEESAEGSATRTGTSMPGGTPSGNAPTGGRFKNPDEFAKTMLPWAQYVSNLLGGTPALGILGQWAGESGAGKSLSAGYNYAGIKAGKKFPKGDYVLTEEKYTLAQIEHAKKSGETLHRVLGPNDTITKKGKQVTVDQWFGSGEYQKALNEGKQWVQVKSYFADFGDLKSFADGYASVLKNKRYADAVAASTPADFGYKVAAAGYATADPGKYADKVAGFAKAFSNVSAESGGIAIGPRSGYPATLHGTEAIIPLDARTHASKEAVKAVSKAVSGEQMAQQTAENATNNTQPAVVPIPMPMGGGGGKSAPPQRPDNSVKASVRHEDNAFMRAISKDFAHPSTFSSVGAV